MSRIAHENIFNLFRLKIYKFLIEKCKSRVQEKHGNIQVFERVCNLSLILGDGRHLSEICNHCLCLDVRKLFFNSFECCFDSLSTPWNDTDIESSSCHLSTHFKTDAWVSTSHNHPRVIFLQVCVHLIMVQLRPNTSPQSRCVSQTSFQKRIRPQQRCKSDKTFNQSAGVRVEEVLVKEINSFLHL